MAYGCIRKDIMEENEIIEEVLIEDDNQIFDGIELDYPEQESESLDSYSQDQLISALLSLINEQASQDEEAVDDDLIVSEGEDVPVLVSVDNGVDYSDLLLSLDSRLENIEENLYIPEVQSIDTPLAEYQLTNVLLVSILFVSLIYIGYRFIKDNLLHF